MFEISFLVFILSLMQYVGTCHMVGGGVIDAIFDTLVFIFSNSVAKQELEKGMWDACGFHGEHKYLF